MGKFALTILIMVTLLASITAYAANDDTSTAASEILTGNGTRAGYVLGHGNVVSGSEWVDIGARHGVRNKDYTIDYDSGTLYFTEPVSTMDSVQVDYRYSEKNGSSGRSVTSPGMVALKLGGATQMNMLYSYRTAGTSLGFASSDVLTYGMNNTTSFAGSSTLSGMFYMATPQGSNRLSLNTTAQSSQTAKKIKKDKLIIQNADLGVGKVRLKLGYQDVGQDFAGFTSLNDSKTASTDVLKQLEKEKGIRRMNFSADMPTGKNAGFNFAMGQIEDQKDNILNQSLGYTGDIFKFSFTNRKVGKDFSRFTDLKEADRTQLSNEAGMQRMAFGIQLRTGIASDSKAVWSGMNMTQLNGNTGSLCYRTVDLSLGKVTVQADIRTMDPTFDKMTALTDDERMRMALIARRQFDPTAQASAVTTSDKAQVNSETGLDRSTYIVQMQGPATTWLSLSSIDSSTGGLSRGALNISTKSYSFYLNHQSIDKTFSRLSSLQAIERLHFGNEYGMTRTETGGKLTIAGGNLAITNAYVVDYKGAGVNRNSVEFKNPKLKFKANFQDIDGGFDRISDLSDSDKATLLRERGFRKSDYSINFQACKYLNIDSYIFNSSNANSGQTLGQNRYKIVYSPKSGLKVTLLKDNCAYINDNGDLTDYSHQEVTFNNTFNLLGGLLLKSRTDTYAGKEGDEVPVNTTINENHLESNQNAKISFTMDLINSDLDSGELENTRSVGVKLKTIKNLSLIGGCSLVDRGTSESETDNKFGFEWTARKDLKLSYTINNRNGGTNGDQNTSQFAMSGMLIKRFLMFSDVTVTSGTNTTTLRGKQTACDNALKVSAGMFGGKFMLDNSDKLNTKNGLYYTSRILQYETGKDAKSRYSLTLYRQNLITTDGTPAKKYNYALDYKLSGKSTITFSSYYGKDGQNGTVSPVGGTVMKFSRGLKNGTTLTADYNSDINESSSRHARVMGCGLSGKMRNNAVYEIYCGWCMLNEDSSSVNKGVFRAKYDHKISSDRYITFSWERKSGVDKSTINSNEGDNVGRIDFRMSFN